MNIAPVEVYLALGSNLGDRAAMLRSAIDALRRVPGIVIQKSSRFYETDPVGDETQGKFINAAIGIQTHLSPRQLLAVCLDIERAHGRDRSHQQKWGPRTLDIDLLLYGSEVIEESNSPRLRVPHPEMLHRRFVLEPLAEIAPNVLHPEAGKCIRDLLRQLEA